VSESAGVAAMAEAPEVPGLAESLDDHQSWTGQLAALDGEDELVPRLPSLAADVLHRFRAIQQENAALLQQVATLEAQIEAMLTERVTLAARVQSLEERIEHLQAEHSSEQTVLEKLVAELERTSRRAARVERQPIPIRPFADSSALVPRDLPLVGTSGQSGAAPAENLSPAARFQHPTVSDEETLLGTAAVTAPLGEASPRASVPGAATAVQGAPASSSYALIAYPFARFSDLGQFQAAVQALSSVHNVRVRRFAQGTLEMRVDYDGSAPLTDVLRGLPLAIEEVAQEEAFRLRVRLGSANSG
jgi:TolA-binding protein